MAERKREVVGHVGVDAGMIYIGDPCYVIGKDIGRRSFEQFIEKYIQPHGWDESGYLIEPVRGRDALGICVRSGYGDGCYPVEVEYVDDIFGGQRRIASVKVTFIEEEE